MRSIAILLAAVGLCLGQNPSPQMSTQAKRMEPQTIKPGDILTITGLSLGKDRVDEVYLTDHRFDLKMKVLEQSDTVLKIRVPAFAKAGRQQLLVLTAGKDPAYLEMPAFVLIEVDEVASNTAPAAVARPEVAAVAKH